MVGRSESCNAGTTHTHTHTHIACHSARCCAVRPTSHVCLALAFLVLLFPPVPLIFGAQNAWSVLELPDDRETRGASADAYGTYGYNIFGLRRPRSRGASNPRSLMEPRSQRPRPVKRPCHVKCKLATSDPKVQPRIWRGTTSQWEDDPSALPHDRLTQKPTPALLVDRVAPADAKGPGLVIQFGVPEGYFRLAFYFFAHDSESRHYVLKLSDGDTGELLTSVDVVDFADGTHKSFLVRGPRELSATILPDSETNTSLSGIFLDEFEPPSLFPDPDLPLDASPRSGTPRVERGISAAPPRVATAFFRAQDRFTKLADLYLEDPRTLANKNAEFEAIARILHSQVLGPEVKGVALRVPHSAFRAPCSALFRSDPILALHAQWMLVECHRHSRHYQAAKTAFRDLVAMFAHYPSAPEARLACLVKLRKMMSDAGRFCASMLAADGRSISCYIT